MIFNRCSASHTEPQYATHHVIAAAAPSPRIGPPAPCPALPVPTTRVDLKHENSPFGAGSPFQKSRSNIPASQTLRRSASLNST